MGPRLTLLACVLAACSPYGGGAFECAVDTDCSGGTCSSGFCSFPDGTCPSGQRYGDLSGPNSGKCVGAQIDAGIDTPISGDDMGSCYGSGLVHACFLTPPSGTRTLNATIDTGSSPLCDQDSRNSAWCVIAGSSIDAQGTVTVTGPKPLVLVSTGTLTISGVLDVASHRVAGIVGAGADPTTCNAGTAPTLTSGGGGGSFGGAGGTGAATGGGTAGTPGATVTPTMLQGGCPGQNGAGTGGGARGHGGGAVYLIAATSISVIGTINASGSGGTNAGANSSSGGGGGGAGGFIGLESPSVAVTGSVFANGGGGAEASGAQSTGSPGGDPVSATTAAAGGAGTSNFGSDGGDGSVGATLIGSNGSTTCLSPCTTPPSGGGGGGGAGIIRVLPTQTLGGSVSPPPT